jgi:hypothetical protein
MQLGQRRLVVGDRLLKLGDAAGDVTARLGLEVVVFKTEELVAPPPQISDGLLDLAGALAWGGGAGLLGRLQHLPSVGEPIWTVDRASEEPEGCLQSG